MSLLLCSVGAAAQATPVAQSTAVVAENGTGPAGIIPVTRGFNASLITAMQHDSDNGWSSILTPGLAWRFNPAFSVNASVPIYGYINVVENTGTRANPVYVQQTEHGVPGDTALGATFEIHPELLSYTATFIAGLPSGNTAYGIGSGHVGYNFNNHFEKEFGIFTPNVEAGFTNSSSLISTRVHKSYTTEIRWNEDGLLSCPWQWPSSPWLSFTTFWREIGLDGCDASTSFVFGSHTQGSGCYVSASPDSDGQLSSKAKSFLLGVTPLILLFGLTLLVYRQSGSYLGRRSARSADFKSYFLRSCTSLHHIALRGIRTS